MLKIKTLVPSAVAFLTAVLVMPLASAASPRSVDPLTLDIAGVKTGMSYDEALAAAAAHFRVPASAFRAERYPRENLVTRTKLPSTFTYEKDGVTFQVHFEGRVPVDKARPLAASLIIYEVRWSAQNAQEMEKAALAKYGEQSNAPNKLPLAWCKNPSPNPGIGCSSGEANLTLSQVKMQLSDPSWTFARIKYIEASQSVKPAF